MSMISEMAAAVDKYIEQGFHLVPIEPRRKFPTTNNWGSKTLNDVASAFDFYQQNPDWNMGVALGSSNVCSLDIDCMESFQMILADFGVDYEQLKEFPRIRGASKGARMMFRVPIGMQLPYRKLTWPTQCDSRKRFTVFELRSATDGSQKQDVLPPSIHPATGKPYVWEVEMGSELAEPPVFLLSLWQAFESFQDQMKSTCPWHIEPVAPKARTVKRDIGDGESVIDRYNAEVSIEHNLQKYGYSCRGKRWLSPHSTTGLAGVRLFDDGTCWIDHASDPLCSSESGEKVSAFDLFRAFEHDMDYTDAVRDAAEILGMNDQHDAPVADISAILATMRESVSKNQIQSSSAEGEVFEVPDAPDDLWSLNGVIGAIVEHTLRTAPKPLVMPTTEAAFAAVAHVIGRHFCTDGASDGTYANLYSMIIADTGEGKEAVKRTLTQLLGVADMSEQVASIATSKGALATVLHSSPVCTMLNDEIGHTLQAASGNKSNPNQIGLMGGLLELYGLSSQNGVFMPESYSMMSELKKGDKADVDAGFRLKIHQPFMNLFGITTPYMLMDNIIKSWSSQDS